MDWSGTGATRVPSISCHQLPVNHCNYHQLECACQKAGGADTQGRTYTCTNFKSVTKKKKSHMDPRAQKRIRHILAFTDANHNFKRTSKPSSIQMYAV